MKTLIILAHPDIEGRSIANRIIIDRVKGIEGVEIRDLYRMYPDFKIDVESEQRALIAADMIIFQFPFYWYGMPGMLKEWMDRVFVHGFAFGSEGYKCKGKQFLVSTTIGGPADAYQKGGNNNFTVAEFLRPLEQAANLSGMVYNAPLYTHNMIYIPGIYNKKEDVEQRAREHADKLAAFIEGK
jgi:glutathione-regulated potassium-efflux system ancillary protein KefF